MKILIKGATDQVARKREVRKVLSRWDRNTEAGDIIHKNDIYLEAKYGASVDTVHFIEGIHDHVDIRIYDTRHNILCYLSLCEDDILGVEVIV